MVTPEKDLFGLHAPGARFNAPEAKLNAMGCRPKDTKRNGKDRNLGEVVKWIVKMISKWLNGTNFFEKFLKVSLP